MVLFATVIEIQMTAILSNADSDVREPVDPCNNSLTILFSQIKYIKVHTATRWTIRHSDLIWPVEYRYQSYTPKFGKEQK